MIQTILTKCLEELNKETPRLDYIRGMIETLLATQEKPDIVGQKIMPSVPVIFNQSMDEASMLDAKARASLAQVKAAGDVQTQ